MRTPRTLIAVALAALLVAAPSAAEETTVLPLDMTLYLHGAQVVGELETPDTFLTAYRQMSETAPTGTEAKSVQVVNYLRGPNTKCSGNGLVPTWSAPVEGTITGPVTVTLNTAAIPGSTLQARLFADVGANACNESYVPALADAVVNVVEGQAVTTIAFESVEAVVTDNLVLMVNAPGTDVNMPADQPSPSQPFAHTRLFYDAVSAASSVQFSCIPVTAGATTCLW